MQTYEGNIKGGKGGGDIIKLINLHILCHLFLPLFHISKWGVNENLEIYLKHIP